MFKIKYKKHKIPKQMLRRFKKFNKQFLDLEKFNYIQIL